MNINTLHLDFKAELAHRCCVCPEIGPAVLLQVFGDLADEVIASITGATYQFRLSRLGGVRLIVAYRDLNKGAQASKWAEVNQFCTALWNRCGIRRIFFIGTDACLRVERDGDEWAFSSVDLEAGIE